MMRHWEATQPQARTMIRLFILDFDGTLADTHEAIVTCVSATFDAFGQAGPPREAIAQAVGEGLSMPDVMRRVHGEAMDAYEVARWTARYRALYDTMGLPKTRLFAGVSATLRHLRAAGRHIAIVSNKGTAAVEQALSHYGIRDDIDLVVGDHPDVPKKPNPAPYQCFVRPRFPGIPPSETLVVGDTHADIGFARAIGAQACWARYGYGDAQRCTSLAPEYAIDDFKALADCIA
jgi:phosphoglycolate phosphatase